MQNAGEDSGTNNGECAQEAWRCRGSYWTLSRRWLRIVMVLLHKINCWILKGRHSLVSQDL
jgi:hypothetical protein